MVGLFQWKNVFFYILYVLLILWPNRGWEINAHFYSTYLVLSHYTSMNSQILNFYIITWYLLFTQLCLCLTTDILPDVDPEWCFLLPILSANLMLFSSSKLVLYRKLYCTSTVCVLHHSVCDFTFPYSWSITSSIPCFEKPKLCLSTLHLTETNNVNIRLLTWLWYYQVLLYVRHFLTTNTYQTKVLIICLEWDKSIEKLSF